MDASLNATAAELPAYHRALAGTYKPVWRWDVLDMNTGAQLNALPAPDDGSLIVDRTGEVTRIVTGTVPDGDHVAQLVDTGSPTDTATPLNRILRVRHTIYVPELGRDVTATPFYGWLTKAEPDGDEISIEGQGLERRAMFGCQPMTIPAGTRVVDAIRRIFYYRYGERRFRYPANNPARLLKPVTVGWSDGAAGWPVGKRLAASIDLTLLYPGDGWLTLRPMPDHVSMRFVAGDDPAANITSPLKPVSDALETRNRVEARGKRILKRKGDDKEILLRGNALLDNRFANSRAALARNDVPFDMPVVLSDDAYNTQALVNRAARRELADRQKLVQSISWTSPPYPHLDFGDLADAVTPDYTLQVRIQGFTLPTTGEDMTVNRMAKLNPKRRR